MKRNRFIDLLKGICILFVIITHASWTAEERNLALFNFWIDMAVPLFMMISGYVFFLSFERNGIEKAEQAYRPRVILPKLVRYTLPFALTFIVQVILGMVRGADYSPLSLIQLFATGGEGPGSYYYPIMVQFVFLFPLIYFIVKKKGFAGVILCGVCNLAFEILKWAYGMTQSEYRLLIFRYILLIAFGCYLATRDLTYRPRKSLCAASLALGIGFIVLTAYLGYEPILFSYWTSTSAIACLYIMPLSIPLLLKCRVGFSPLELLGKASFHIFLTQMLYFHSVLPLLPTMENRALQLCAHLLICATVGVIFYLLETPLSKWIIRKIHAFHPVKS